MFLIIQLYLYIRHKDSNSNLFWIYLQNKQISKVIENWQLRNFSKKTYSCSARFGYLYVLLWIKMWYLLVVTIESSKKTKNKKKKLLSIPTHLCNNWIIKLMGKTNLLFQHEYSTL